MKLLETRVEHRAGSVRLVGVVEAEGRGVLEPYFSYPEAYADFVFDSADAFVPALLVPALKTGEDLEIVPPVSPRLLGRLQRLQDIMLSFHPEFHPVKVAARLRSDDPAPRHAAVATLFSGGVDSFYTLFKARSEGPAPTHLLFLKGIEQPLRLSKGVESALVHTAAVASAVGVEVIAGESNLRDCFTLNYELYYDGAALCSAALALSNGLRTLLVPASHSYVQYVPWGTHPLLDELWSTERLEVVHHGAEARRVDKIERVIAREPIALRYLRVCLENSGGGYNCGRCRKCVRTMLALDVLGLLGNAELFSTQPLPALLRQLTRDIPVYPEELLEFSRRIGRRPDLTRGLAAVLRQRRRKDALRILMANLPGLDRFLAARDELLARRRASRKTRAGAAQA